MEIERTKCSINLLSGLFVSFLLFVSCVVDGANSTTDGSKNTAVKILEKKCVSVQPWDSNKSAALEKLKENYHLFPRLSPKLQKDKDVINLLKRQKAKQKAMQKKMQKRRSKSTSLVEPSVNSKLAFAAKIDTDKDGISNKDDVCISIANPDQADRDKDGIGDACDACPDKAAPRYATGCPMEKKN